MKQSTQTMIEETKTFELNAEDIKDYLVWLGKATKNDKLEIYFQVPGGGDWSNTTIDISSEDPIYAKVQSVVFKP